MSKPISMSADEKRWRAEDDARTLMRAAEIQKDKARLKAAKDWAKQQLAGIQSVANAK